MDIVDKIAKVEVGANDKPKTDVKIEKSIFFKQKSERTLKIRSDFFIFESLVMPFLVLGLD